MSSEERISFKIVLPDDKGVVFARLRPNESFKQVYEFFWDLYEDLEIKLLIGLSTHVRHWDTPRSLDYLDGGVIRVLISKV